MASELIDTQNGIAWVLAALGFCKSQGTAIGFDIYGMLATSIKGSIITDASSEYYDEVGIGETKMLKDLGGTEVGECSLAWIEENLLRFRIIFTHNLTLNEQTRPSWMAGRRMGRISPKIDFRFTNTISNNNIKVTATHKFYTSADLSGSTLHGYYQDSALTLGTMDYTTSSGTVRSVLLSTNAPYPGSGSLTFEEWADNSSDAGSYNGHLWIGKQILQTGLLVVTEEDDPAYISYPVAPPTLTQIDSLIPDLTGCEYHILFKFE